MGYNKYINNKGITPNGDVQMSKPNQQLEAEIRKQIRQTRNAIAENLDDQMNDIDPALAKVLDAKLTKQLKQLKKVKAPYRDSRSDMYLYAYA